MNRDESNVSPKLIDGEVRFPCDSHGKVISRKPETFGKILQQETIADFYRLRYPARVVSDGKVRMK